MYKNSMTHYIAKFMVDFLFYIGIFCVLAVPFASEFFNYYFGFYSRVLSSFIITLFCSGTVAVYILYLLKKMFHSLLGGNPFIAENVKHLRKMSVACALIAIIYFLELCLMFTFSALTIVIIFVIGSLFCLTLKDLFKQAIAYKEENELTI